MTTYLTRWIWYPSNLPDRVVNIWLLLLVLMIFVLGFDYAKVPIADFLDLRASPIVQSVAIAALALIGCLTIWGLAREEYVSTARSILPSIVSYLVLALLCCLAWLIRGAFATKDPYRIIFGVPISWPVARQIAICGQLFLLANLGTLYVKKADGSAVRAFAASNARSRRLLQRLFGRRSSDAEIESLRNELKTLASKKNALDATLHAAEATEANRISAAAKQLNKAIDSVLISSIKADPAMALAHCRDSLAVFGITLQEQPSNDRPS